MLAKIIFALSALVIVGTATTASAMPNSAEKAWIDRASRTYDGGGR